MKHLYRSQQDTVIAGVCGGLAIYFERDPILFRILFIILTLTPGIGLTLYLLLWIVLPTAQQEFANQEQLMRQNLNEMRHSARELGSQARDNLAHGPRTDSRNDNLIIIGAIFVGLGLTLLFRNIGLLVWMRHLWPLVLIGLGIALLLDHRKERV